VYRVGNKHEHADGRGLTHSRPKVAVGTLPRHSPHASSIPAAGAAPAPPRPTTLNTKRFVASGCGIVVNEVGKMLRRNAP
jgi:hypothetical protein